jgi:putative hydrolase of HD superfamily
MPDKRIDQQTTFLMEIDKLKNVIRRNHINGGERLENTAEHSWHVALQAVVFHEDAGEAVELLQVVKMLLIHDLVEIIAGDTYIYGSPADMHAQADKEAAAARTLFGMLPADQADAFSALWQEFEAVSTPDARFAKAMDRLLPFLQNYRAGGLSWRQHGVTPEMVQANLLKIKPGSETLWRYAVGMLERAVQAGMFSV